PCQYAGMSEFEIRTPRLRVRSWRDDDFEPYAAMNADARVMEFFPGVVSRDESRVRFERGRARMAERGYGLWPVEVVGGAPVLGEGGPARPGLGGPLLAGR